MTTATAFITGLATTMTLNGVATIDAGETATLAIPNAGRSVVRLGFPTMVGTTVTFTAQAYPASGDVADAAFRTVVDKTGSPVSYTVTDNSLVIIAELSGCAAFTIISGSAETQGAAIEVACRGDNPFPFERAVGGVTPGDFAAPALTLGTTNVAGSSGKVLATDSTILTFDGTVPVTLTNPDTAAVGNATTAARRNHVHGIPAPGTVSTISSGASPGNGAGTGFATDTHIHGVPTLATAPTLKYKSSAQTFSTNVSFADVAAASGTFGFAIGANEVWIAEFVIQLSWTGTGGVKFQLTGPSSPTAVAILAQLPLSGVDGGTLAFTSPATPTSSVFTFDTAVTAFSTSIAARNSVVSTSATTVNVYENSSGTQGAFVRIVAVIQNGANAGTVTLQAAQNSSNNATSLGVGSYMIAQKAA